MVTKKAKKKAETMDIKEAVAKNVAISKAKATAQKKKVYVEFVMYQGQVALTTPAGNYIMPNDSTRQVTAKILVENLLALGFDAEAKIKL